MVNQVKAWGTKLSVLKSKDNGSRVAEEMSRIFTLLWYPEVEFFVLMIPVEGKALNMLFSYEWH